VTKWERAHRLPFGVEIALAFATGIETFALAAAILAGVDAVVVVALLGVVYALVVDEGRAPWRCYGVVVDEGRE
jgi:hypothetical protein